MTRSQALFRFDLATIAGGGPRLALCVYDLSSLPGNTRAYKTVTNDAEAVVDELVERGHLKAGMRLIYRDTRGIYDEIIVKDGRFAGFVPLNLRDREAALRALAQEAPA